MRKWILLALLLIAIFSCNDEKILCEFSHIENVINKNYCVFYEGDKQHIIKIYDDIAFLKLKNLKKGDNFYLSTINSDIDHYELTIYKELSHSSPKKPEITPLPDPKIDIENNGTVNIYMEE
jgi:hypothetical protein